MQSKVIFFLLLALSLFLFWGCSDDLKRNTVIPYTPIETRINLGWADYQDLNFPGRPVYILYSTPTGELLGYNGNGIIVMQTDMNEYKCYDATCPNCIDADTHIEITAGDQIAKCPTCKTQFFLPYGIPLNAEEDENEEKKIAPLQSYPVDIAGNILIVRY